MSRRPRLGLSGFTLVEVLIAITILAMISMLIYGAFSGMQRSRAGLQRLNDRYREGRMALARLTRDLQSAYLSNHVPPDTSLQVSTTAFVGSRRSPLDRVDFNAFSYRRLDRNVHESDQAEISYFGSEDPEHRGVMDLARRVNPRLDLEPSEGGRVSVLATDVDLFELSYLDAMTGEWLESWDTTQAIGQPDRLPKQIRVLLVLNGGERRGTGRDREPLKLMTKIAPQILQPLSFAR